MKKILEKSGIFVRGKKWEPCFNVPFAIVQRKRSLWTDELSEKRVQAVALQLNKWLPWNSFCKNSLSCCDTGYVQWKGSGQGKALNGRITYPVSNHPLFTVDTCQAVSCQRLWGCMSEEPYRSELNISLLLIKRGKSLGQSSNWGIKEWF